MYEESKMASSTVELRRIYLVKVFIMDVSDANLKAVAEFLEKISWVKLL